MARYYKLIDPIKTATTLNVAQNQDGKSTYIHIRLEPGQVYELNEDQLFIRSLKNAKIDRRYSEHLVNELKALKINYTEHFCKSCGGRAKRISYPVVEIIEAESEETDV